MKLKYFAWIAEIIDKREESLEIPSEIETIGQLIDYLSSIDEAYKKAFEKRKNIKFTNAEINYNLDEFDEMISSFGSEIACFISSPYDHPTSKDSSLPKEGYWKHIEKKCSENNIVLIVDDVRTGFRIDLKGSHNAFGFSPDLVCLGKAMANGYPISALVGKKSLKDAANKVYFSGTQFFNSAPMAASKATLEELQNLNAIEIMTVSYTHLTLPTKA